MQFSTAQRSGEHANFLSRSSRAAAVVVLCSSRKTLRPDRDATAVSVGRGSQVDVENAWRERLIHLPPTCQAGSLYAGRGFQLGRQAAAAAGSVLYVASAGLGLVAATQIVPAYGLTVGGRGPESVGARVVGRFDSAAWWRAVSEGPFSAPLGALFADGSELPVLVALTQPYAKLLAQAFDALDDAELRRLRVVGIGLVNLLPERVSRQVLPYDERLEGVLPGTKADFAQRALLHFAAGGLSVGPAGGISEHRAWVARSLAGRSAPVRPTRRQLPDDAIIDVIKVHLPETRAIGKLLRILRDDEAVACEQARFTRLYRVAVEERGA